VENNGHGQPGEEVSVRRVEIGLASKMVELTPSIAFRTRSLVIRPPEARLLISSAFVLPVHLHAILDVSRWGGCVLGFKVGRRMSLRRNNRTAGARQTNTIRLETDGLASAILLRLKSPATQLGRH